MKYIVTLILVLIGYTLKCQTNCLQLRSIVDSSKQKTISLNSIEFMYLKSESIDFINAINPNKHEPPFIIGHTGKFLLKNDTMIIARSYSTEIYNNEFIQPIYYRGNYDENSLEFYNEYELKDIQEIQVYRPRIEYKGYPEVINMLTLTYSLLISPFICINYNTGEFNEDLYYSSNIISLTCFSISVTSLIILTKKKKFRMYDSIHNPGKWEIINK